MAAGVELDDFCHPFQHKPLHVSTSHNNQPPNTAPALLTAARTFYTPLPLSPAFSACFVAFPGRSWCRAAAGAWLIGSSCGFLMSCSCALAHLLLLESHRYEWTTKKMSIEPCRDGGWFSSCCLDISQVCLGALSNVKKTFFPPLLKST